MHARDVVQQLVDADVAHTTDFEWASQLRYYWRDNVWVEMVQACIAYGYEYLGNTPRYAEPSLAPNSRAAADHRKSPPSLSSLPSTVLLYLPPSPCSSLATFGIANLCEANEKMFSMVQSLCMQGKFEGCHVCIFDGDMLHIFGCHTWKSADVGSCSLTDASCRSCGKPLPCKSAAWHVHTNGTMNTAGWSSLP